MCIWRLKGESAASGSSVRAAALLDAAVPLDIDAMNSPTKRVSPESAMRAGRLGQPRLAGFAICCRIWSLCRLT